MKLELNDPRDWLFLSTPGDGVTIQINMNVIAQPNGSDVKCFGLALPADRTYLSKNAEGTTGIMVLPEGFTPETFGWDSRHAVKLSALIKRMEEHDR